ncbi:hypothetical protein E2C01_086634 [Portunus trituberculatus]|uniref:Uncharacterized protein n=1 Tax=Portunus trituberculatus TaxID=210409 RepID=A0A5B7JF58_PORTR|nr:hypothetical protein [Portunus trituberculatus]
MASCSKALTRTLPHLNTSLGQLTSPCQATATLVVASLSYLRTSEGRDFYSVTCRVSGGRVDWTASCNIQHNTDHPQKTTDTHIHKPTSRHQLKQRPPSLHSLALTAEPRASPTTLGTNKRSPLTLRRPTPDPYNGTKWTELRSFRLVVVRVAG